MGKNVRLRLFSNLVIVYMLLALGWWSFLLFTKNKDAFQSKAALQKIMMIANNDIQNDQEYMQSATYKDLAKQYKRQEWMILGEAFVFAVILVIGIWFINRGYNQQVTSAQQSRNFLLSITHELKSPLASIQLVLETLKKRTLQPKQIQHLSSNALRETKRLNTMVTDLLLAAKVETTYQPHIENISISQLLKETINIVQQRYPKALLEYKSTPEEIKVEGDKAGLISVTTNLLENAIKYGQAAPTISSTLQQKNGAILLEIADNGIGISDLEKKKVFERFYRIGNEDTRKTKGTGLGLYIVDQIVKAHQGTINIRDNYPEGTIFTIQLPIEQV